MDKILLLIQLPPPMHGASMMNKNVVSIIGKPKYNVNVIELKFVKKMNNLGVFSISKLIKMFIIAFRIFFSCLRFKPSLVYFTLSPTGGAFYRDAFYVFLLKLFKSKIVYHLHGKGIKNQLNKKWKKIIYKFVFDGVHVIHLSSKLENDINTLNYKKISFIPNGIKKVKYNINLRKEFKEVQLIFLSNLTISKGLLVLLDACKILKQKGYQFCLNIIGSEYDIKTKELNLIIRKYNLLKNVNILGPKYDKQKYNFLINSDIFVFPTFNDCFPLVLLEAMQMSLPIISTDEGAISEIVDDNKTGFIVEKNNVDQLVDKLILLIENKSLRRKMGKLGRSKFLNEYTISKFQENIESYFINIFNEK